jgi:hypothetical protein
MEALVVDQRIKFRLSRAQGHSALERLGQLINPMNLSEIEPVTSRLLA